MDSPQWARRPQMETATVLDCHEEGGLRGGAGVGVPSAMGGVCTGSSHTHKAF